MVDPPSWDSVCYMFDAERSDGALPSHLRAGVNELCLDHSCGEHAHVPVRAHLQCLRLAERVHRGSLEEEAGHPQIGNHYL